MQEEQVRLASAAASSHPDVNAAEESKEPAAAEGEGDQPGEDGDADLAS